MKIEHKFTTSSRAYDEEIAELWIDLPNGEKLYFSDIEFSWIENDDTREKRVNQAKERILEQLKLLCK